MDCLILEYGSVECLIMILLTLPLSSGTKSCSIVFAAPTMEDMSKRSSKKYMGLFGDSSILPPNANKQRPNHTLSDTEGEILIRACSKCVVLMVHGVASQVLSADISFSSRAIIAASFICQ